MNPYSAHYPLEKTSLVCTELYSRKTGFLAGFDGSQRFSGIAYDKIVMRIPLEHLLQICNVLSDVIGVPGSINSSQFFSFMDRLRSRLVNVDYSHISSTGLVYLSDQNTKLICT
jgi:hypothetical protein